MSAFYVSGKNPRIYWSDLVISNWEQLLKQIAFIIPDSM